MSNKLAIKLEPTKWFHFLNKKKNSTEKIFSFPVIVSLSFYLFLLLVVFNFNEIGENNVHPQPTIVLYFQ